MKEEVFRYGEHGLGFGMLSLPDNSDNAPIVIAFNAGMIHREGPYRLNALVSRQLAASGYIALRVDLAGKGDSPEREAVSNRESVNHDWKYIKQGLIKRFGVRSYILMGLCSGADNAIKITAYDKSICGLVLLDAISPKDKHFYRRELLAKLSNIHKWINLPFTLLKRLRQKLGMEHGLYQEMLNLRDEPWDDDVGYCFEHIAATNGRVLAVFTSQALPCYNQHGQLVRALNIPGLSSCCEEVFWPEAEHLYPVQVHRDRLVRNIASWGEQHLEHFKQTIS